MEYHDSRFVDYSLLVFKDNELVALLPANIKDDNVYSHQGLSYGGLILGKEAGFLLALNAFKAILEYLESNGVNTMYLKLIPRMYIKLPSDEIDYLMFKVEAKLYRRDISSVIDLRQHLNILSSSNRKRGLKRALKNKLIIKEVDDFDDFWGHILIPNLKARYNVAPVHSKEEIKLLKNKFPNNIRQFNVYNDKEIVAGTTIFESDLVAHVQYIAANSERQTLGSLDLLFHELISKTFSKKTYFDFGISNESDGQYINEGLINWKSSFGGKTIVNDFYKVDVSNHKLLDSALI